MAINLNNTLIFGENLNNGSNNRESRSKMNFSEFLMTGEDVLQCKSSLACFFNIWKYVLIALHQTIEEDSLSKY